MQKTQINKLLKYVCKSKMKELWFALTLGKKEVLVMIQYAGRAV
jgi:hypothetical protein